MNHVIWMLILSFVQVDSNCYYHKVEAAGAERRKWRGGQLKEKNEREDGKGHPV